MLLNEGLPVKRYTRRVKVLPNGGVATTVPGALCESLASLLAPTAQEVRSMLYEIRERHSLSRPLLASFMGTSRHTSVAGKRGLESLLGPLNGSYRWFINNSCQGFQETALFSRSVGIPIHTNSDAFLLFKDPTLVCWITPYAFKSINRLYPVVLF